MTIYTLTSELHNEQAVSRVTREFLDCLHMDYELRGNDYADYGSHPLDVIFVRTGGTEGIFTEPVFPAEGTDRSGDLFPAL